MTTIAISDSNLIDNIQQINNVDDLFTDQQSPTKRRNTSFYGQTKAKWKSKKTSWKVKFALFVVIIAFLFLFVAWFVAYPHHFAIGNNMDPVLDSNGQPVIDPATNKPLEKKICSDSLNGFYYWGTLTSTVGFGDICPKSPEAKVATVFYQVILTLMSIGALWAITDDHINRAAQVFTPKRRTTEG